MADIISFETEKAKRLTLTEELVQSVGAVRNVLGDEKRALNEAMRDEALSHLANALAIALRLRDGSRCKPF
jgi:hypothetical protein